jgi:hypothetical protein
MRYGWMAGSKANPNIGPTAMISHTTDGGFFALSQFSKSVQPRNSIQIHSLVEGKSIYSDEKVFDEGSNFRQ